MPKIFDNSSTGNDATTPPDIDEIEVSVFGPIYGEAIALHLGNRNWFIVDSCLDLNRSPAPLSYLKTLNVNVAEDVKQIIVSHWHDDHIRGLSQIIEECHNADVVCTQALGSNEFFQLLRSFNIDLYPETKGVDEFDRIIQILKKRAIKLKKPVSLKYAISDRLLWTDPQNNDSRIYSLSPSDAAVLSANLDFKSLLPKDDRKGCFRLMPHKTNWCAVVLLAVYGDMGILLGSDLEETSNPESGWTAIVNSHLRPKLKAFLYKVPHHGSKTAHNDEVWKSMLIENPIAAVTPFTRSGLPSPSDVERICSQTENAFCTSPINRKKKRRRAPAVEKTLRESGIVIHPINTESGHVRVRIKIGQEPRTDLFGRALPLINLYK